MLSLAVEFTPNATMNTAHHILIYGCKSPGFYERDTPRGIWDCGEMQTTSIGAKLAPVCSGAPEIIYAWAMDAPRLVLPEGLSSYKRYH